MVHEARRLNLANHGAGKRFNADLSNLRKANFLHFGIHALENIGDHADPQAPRLPRWSNVFHAGEVDGSSGFSKFAADGVVQITAPVISHTR